MNNEFITNVHEKAFKGEVLIALENLLRKLDEVQLEPESIFKKQHDKELFETSCMHVYRKYAAARYHFVNVKRFIRKQEESLAADEGFPNGLENESSEAKNWRRADEFVYELSAFLTALKSGLDYSAMLIKYFNPGLKDIDSISALMKIAEKGRKGTIFNVLRDYSSWITYLRDYRHHLIHRLILTADTGHEVAKKGGITAKAIIPVAIPKNPPTLVLDTRRARHFKEMPEGVARIHSEGSIKINNGNKEITSFSVRYETVPGYITIVEFMADQIRNFERFFVDYFHALAQTDFKPYVGT